jgi:hypothetical protein
MTKYKIKIQNTNQDNTPDILFAIGAQIEEACQLLEAEKENSLEINSDHILEAIQYRPKVNN